MAKLQRPVVMDKLSSSEPTLELVKHFQGASLFWTELIQYYNHPQEYKF